MRIVGNSTGIAPSSRNCSHKTAAWRGVRVTRTRFPCKGCVALCFLLIRFSTILTLLQLDSTNSLDNFGSPLIKRLFSQIHAELFSACKRTARGPDSTLADANTTLPIKADHQPGHGERPINNFSISRDGQIAASPQVTHKHALRAGRCLDRRIGERSEQRFPFRLVAYLQP